MKPVLAIHREDDNELLGYVRQNEATWEALTIFGYAFATVSTAEQARALVLEQGLSILSGTWEYYDDESAEWLPCALVEVSADRARVARMDGPYADTSKTYLITSSVATKLRKG